MLDYQKFKTWLETANCKNNIVGCSNDPECCPIANYLKELNDYLWLEVGDNDVDICYRGDRDPITYPLPTWAQKFVRQIDGDEEESLSISPKTALSILSKIEV